MIIGALSFVGNVKGQQEMGTIREVAVRLEEALVSAWMVLGGQRENRETREKDEALGQLGKAAGLQNGGRRHIKYQLPGTRKMTRGLRVCTTLVGDPSSVPALTSGGSQPLVTSAPGDLTCVLASTSTRIHMHIPTHRHIQTHITQNQS